ncbi:DUF2341 domain-containing protein [Paraliomyxa miuraensis]|uniref:DUF2341 domain-containing protein n=1 Tax=Paraliomyxa miuraensis TaxID=376150 RepID=UPI0022546E6F|nr:LamG-like jellyroll fold domain-containing protein [Paraliomyxa miuraensis]MCX4247177.1 hypothetical protein [Paraliomyxa miuraensis]
MDTPPTLGIVGVLGLVVLGCTPNPGGIGSSDDTQTGTTAADTSGGPSTTASADTSNPTTSGSVDDSTTVPTVSTSSSDSGEPEAFYRRELTIHGETLTNEGPLRDFTVRVMITGDMGLRHVDAGGHVLDADGADLVFRDPDLQPLGRELMSYGADSGRLAAWVKVPEISTDEPTTIYLDYGAPSLVGASLDQAWNDDYVGVWHFEDVVLDGGPILDSSIAGNDGIARNMDDIDGGIAGRAGSGVSFSKSNAAIEITGGGLDLPGPLTFEGWGRMTGQLTSNGFQRLFHKGGATAAPLLLWVGDPTVEPIHPFGRYTLGVNQLTAQQFELAYAIPAFSYSDWHHYAAVIGEPGTDAVLFVDGVRVAADTIDDLVDTGHSTLYFGNQDDMGLDQHWSGFVDEFRFSNVARSDAWIEAGFRTIDDPTGFAAVGPEQSLP